MAQGHEWITPWYNKPWTECERCGILKAIATEKHTCGPVQGAKLPGQRESERMSKAIRISAEAADQLTELRKMIAGEGNPLPTASATVGKAIDIYLELKLRQTVLRDDGLST